MIRRKVFEWKKKSVINYSPSNCSKPPVKFLSSIQHKSSYFVECFACLLKMNGNERKKIWYGFINATFWYLLKPYDLWVMQWLKLKLLFLKNLPLQRQTWCNMSWCANSEYAQMQMRFKSCYQYECVHEIKIKTSSLFWSYIVWLQKIWNIVHK